MPLTTGLAARTPAPECPDYVWVLKFNPNHDEKGRFSFSQLVSNYTEMHGGIATRKMLEKKKSVLTRALDHFEPFWKFLEKDPHPNRPHAAPSSAATRED